MENLRFHSLLLRNSKTKIFLLEYCHLCYTLIYNLIWILLAVFSFLALPRQRITQPQLLKLVTRGLTYMYMCNIYKIILHICLCTCVYKDSSLYWSLFCWISSVRGKRPSQVCLRAHRSMLLLWMQWLLKVFNMCSCVVCIFIYAGTIRRKLRIFIFVSCLWWLGIYVEMRQFMEK